jgi:hypothetical protein
MQSVKLAAILLLGTPWLAEPSAAAGSEPCVFHRAAYQRLDRQALERELTTTGLIGSIHGAHAEAGLFVLTVRDPDDFFTHVEYSLIPASAELQQQFAALGRHDEVCVQGHFASNPSPQGHIVVTGLRVLDAWDSGHEVGEYEHEARIPDELVGRSDFVGRIHAVAAEGRILVVEYRDVVLPIFVRDPGRTASLFRGDIVRVHYRLQAWPERPTHLELDPGAAEPVEVLDSIAAWHGTERTLRGRLVLFPRSPQLLFDVYALEVDSPLGVTRTFTLVNFADPEQFSRIRAHLEAIWNQHSGTVRPGRNMLINPEVVLEARGTVNVVSPAQANPQLLVDSAEQIRLAR